MKMAGTAIGGSIRNGSIDIQMFIIINIYDTLLVCQIWCSKVFASKKPNI